MSPNDTAPNTPPLTPSGNTAPYWSYCTLCGAYIAGGTLHYCTYSTRPCPPTLDEELQRLIEKFDALIMELRRKNAEGG